VSGNYKNNVVIPAGGKPAGTRRLFLVEEAENAFLTRRRRLLPGGQAGDLLRVMIIRWCGLLAHLVGNEREMGVTLLGHRDLLLVVDVRFRLGRGGCRAGDRVGRRDIVPGFPVRFRHDDQRRRSSGLPLGDDDRCRAGLVEDLRGRPAERGSAPVAEERLAGGIGSAAGTGFGSNVVPQRVQNREWLSIAGLPQVLQTTGTGRIRVPHRLQNCASSSDTTVPHPGQTGNAGFFSSGTGAPHRLQKSAWSSSPAWPH